MEAPADTTGFSLAERDRRWNAVCKNAAQAALDGILLPLCVDGQNLHLSLEQSRGARAASTGSCFDMLPERKHLNVSKAIRSS
jgi:hypothetical protein